MKFVLISDIHINNYQGEEKRVDSCLEAILKAVTKAAELKTFVVIAGDLFDSGGNMNALVFEKTLMFFEQVSKAYPEVSIYSISGNHDQYGNNDSNVRAYSFVRSLRPYVECVDERVMLLEGKTFLFLPYYSNREYLREKLSQYGETDCLILHNSYPGWTLAPDFSLGDVKQFSMVFAGHIHRYGRLGHTYSIGSPLPRDVSDVDAKGFLVVDTEHKTVERVYTNFPVPTPALHKPATTDLDTVSPNEEIYSLTPTEILEGFARTKKNLEALSYIPKIVQQ
jgi:DNA repair exonuclease SbcCD nuclease subunit